MPMYMMPPFYGRGPPHRGFHHHHHGNHPSAAGEEEREHQGPPAGPFMLRRGGPHGGRRSCHPHRGGWQSHGGKQNQEASPKKKMMMGCGPPHHHHLAKKMFLLSLIDEQNKRAMETKNDELTLTAPQQFHRNDDGTETTLSIDVTGFSPNDLTVRLENHVLTLDGTRTNRLGETFVLYQRVPLDEFVHDETTIQAQHSDDGILKITIAKKEPTPTTIPIRTVVAKPKEEKAFQEAEIVLASNDEAETTTINGAENDETPELESTPTATDDEAETSVSVETVVADEIDEDEEQSWEEVQDKNQ